MFHGARRLALFVLIALVCACAGLPVGVVQGPFDPSGGRPPSGEIDPDGDIEVSSGSAMDPGFAPGGALAAANAPLRTDVLTDPGELPVLKVASGARDPFPLRHTDVKATLSGFTADVTVRQTYSNPYEKPIEATYIFPLPENAAVYSMKIVIGEREIEAVVKERGAARREYEEARREGYSAALLEQERENVFTQSVANIEPKKTIDVVIKYVQDLTYDAGQYEMVFPMVVGPRYIPGAPLDTAPSGKGTYADTTRVPDASRVTPPVAGKGERTGHDISLEVTVAAEGVVSKIDVPTHAVTAETLAGGAVRVALDRKDAIPNRDFVLRYRVAGQTPRATLYAAGKTSGHFSLVVQPPALDVEALVGQRELIFVVDVSGSMSGAPLALSKAAMRAALLRIRPVDTFNVITFSGSTGKVFARPRPANEAAIAAALDYVDALSAGGGTEMLDAIAAALSPEVEKGRHRYVFFLTDGLVGDEDRIVAAASRFVAAIEAGGQRARVFGFGTGSSVNRGLLEGIGRAGKGLSVYAMNREDPERAVNRFYRYIDRSVLRDVKVSFGSLGAAESFPAELPDLFASHPLIVHGRWSGSLAGPVVVRATGPAGPVEIPVTIARAPMDDGWPIQDLLWARSKIAWLTRDLAYSDRAASAREQITDLGVRHHLVTRFTSFVAVDRTRKVGDGSPAQITQPVETPEGVDAEKAGARVFTLDGVSGTPVAKDPSSGSREHPYDFDDDTLSAGGFGPNDATIRVQSSPSYAIPNGNRLNQPIFAAQQLAVQRGARGCHCDVAGGGAGGTGSLLLAAAAIALAVARRRRRAIPCSSGSRCSAAG
jgi:Ca-activated chloride channel homolog